ncbi:hypothetical protein BJ508DRAFT_37802 [Ascobolus immersus RN42]|uniref:Uncharacterized protein n=1 Tax=Ascobolus immersus RN42 TaxID=1160509 RepID=A0A3N4IE27_ASCIM|nr:hypothetical protein BJ508DRAFT_37802 [Ascobolus immersus RN42]
MVKGACEIKLSGLGRYHRGFERKSPERSLKGPTLADSLRWKLLEHSECSGFRTVSSETIGSRVQFGYVPSLFFCFLVRRLTGSGRLRM